VLVAALQHMVLPVLGSSGGAAFAGSANKLLFDVLYQLQKDAGKVLIVTAISAVAPSLSRLPIKSSTVVLGALALAASLIGTLLVGNASIEKGMVRGGGAALLLAVALLVVALIEHLRPRAPAAAVELGAASSTSSRRPTLGRVALFAKYDDDNSGTIDKLEFKEIMRDIKVVALAAVGVPAVVLASRRAGNRRHRREEKDGLLVRQGEALQRALALLARLGSSSEEGTPEVK